MGTKREIKLAILAALFLITCIFVYAGAETGEVRKRPLKDYFQHIAGYEVKRHLGLEDHVVKMLKLDDYLFAEYTGKNGPITLYIGFYYTAAKAYAAHSPLICYPSQGWQIDKKPVDGSLAVGQHEVDYEEIITSHDGQKELVLYWYQAHDRTSVQVYRNKIDMARNKLEGKDEQYAFVRVSVPFAHSSRETAKEIAADFIRAFSPKFREYFAKTEA